MQLMKVSQAEGSKCPSFSLNLSGRQNEIYTNRRCKPRNLSEADCKAAKKQYGLKTSDYLCPKISSSQYIYDICRFRDLNTFNRNNWKLDCNVRICGKNIIRIGALQADYGLMMDSTIWFTARTNTEIQRIVRRLIKETNDNGHDFCIITCANQRLYIKQALVLPPQIKSKKNKIEIKKMNINLLVLDSVSRQHFYRLLPNTVQQLENVSSKGTVYDFELFQSLAPRTFPNMRALFSGMVDQDSDDERNSYGIESLFGKFSNMGYQTILQEDSCWYDPWGAIITENKHNMKLLLNTFDYQKIWQSLQEKLYRLPIDSYGLTHLSCEVFKDYGTTNQFNYPSKVCYNGYHLPEYYLNYTYKFLRAAENIKEAYPLFIYTHLNTGHETSGRRIAHNDFVLARFLGQVAQLRNTLTIVFSDHGPKTSKFARDYLAGRHEIGQAMMFMILPQNVRNIIGESRMSALKVNQQRLITHTDLFHTLMSIYSDTPLGLLTEISAERYCNDIPMYAFMSCLCDDWNENLSDSNEEVYWLAEFALGYLNNLITLSLNNTSYKNCERLIGKRFDKIRKRKDKDGNTVYTFDIIVHKYRDEELFEVSATVFSNKQKKSVAITRWHRVSIYQHFSKCRDKEIDIELCICRKESQNDNNAGREVARILSIPSFKATTQVRLLDSKCLILLTRKKEFVFVTYELTNLCIDRSYNVTFNLFFNTFQSSNELPQTLNVQPWLIYYVTTLSSVGNASIRYIQDNITYTQLPTNYHVATTQVPISLHI